jgi:hypothetical protein
VSSPCLRASAVLIVSALLAAIAAAQGSGNEPDLEIRGKFKAKEMRFEHVPNVDVRFSGTDGRQDVWTSSRKNFPKPVRPNETYRDVEGDVEISTTLPRSPKKPEKPAPPAPERR